MGYSLEIKQRAHDLFVERGLTYEEVAKETGVSISGLKQWGKEGQWVEKQKEFQEDVLSTHFYINKFKVLTLRDVVGKGSKIDQADLNKLNTLSAVMRATAHLGKGNSSQDKAALFIEFMGRFIEYLKDRDPDALRYLENHVRGFADHMKAES